MTKTFSGISKSHLALKSWFTVAYTDTINCSCQPQELRIEEPVVIRDVFCGVDGTMFLTDVGSVYACGSNSDNKLGLNNRQGFIMAMKNIFTKVCVLRIKILFCYLLKAVLCIGYLIYQRFLACKIKIF